MFVCGLRFSEGWLLLKVTIFALLVSHGHSNGDVDKYNNYCHEWNQYKCGNEASWERWWKQSLWLICRRNESSVSLSYSLLVYCGSSGFPQTTTFSKLGVAKGAKNHSSNTIGFCEKVFLPWWLSAVVRTLKFSRNAVANSIVWYLKCCWSKTKGRNWTRKRIPFARNSLHECFHVTFPNFIFSHPQYYKYALPLFLIDSFDNDGMKTWKRYFTLLTLIFLLKDSVWQKKKNNRKCSSPMSFWK